MNAQRLLGTTFTAALAVQTIGAIDPAGGPVALPSPRRYVATFVVWFVLGLAADFGGRAARAAATFSGLVLLTMLVVGPFGRKALTFLQGVSSRYQAQP